MINFSNISIFVTSFSVSTLVFLSLHKTYRTYFFIFARRIFRKLRGQKSKSNTLESSAKKNITQDHPVDDSEDSAEEMPPLMVD